MNTLSSLASPEEIHLFVEIVRTLKRLESPLLNDCSQITICAAIAIDAGLDKTSVNKGYERLTDFRIIVNNKVDYDAFINFCSVTGTSLPNMRSCLSEMEIRALLKKVNERYKMPAVPQMFPIKKKKA